jgi:hypothetical protein
VFFPLFLDSEPNRDLDDTTHHPLKLLGSETLTPCVTVMSFLAKVDRQTDLAIHSGTDGDARLLSNHLAPDRGQADTCFCQERSDVSERNE